MPADLEVLPVEHLPEYVIGFPMHVVITVRAHPEAQFHALPFADFLNLRSSIGVEITGQAGTRPVRIMPRPFIDPASGKRGSALGPGEARRMLVDLSHLLAGSVQPGEYRMQFSYLEPYGSYAASPVTLRFRNPTPAETALLASAAADRKDFDDWGRWTITCPAQVYEGRIAADNPLRFNLVLRRLFCGAEPLDRVDPASLNLLDGLYEPERDALKAELYRLRGDEARYQQLRSQLLLRAPGMAWWVRMIDGGGAFLKSLRAR